MRKRRTIGKRERASIETFGLAPDTKRSILLIIVFVIGLVSLLSLFNIAGVLGVYINAVLTYTFGWTRFFVPIFLVVVVYFLYLEREKNISWMIYCGLFFLGLSINGLLHFILTPEQFFKAIEKGIGGGYIGFLVSKGLYTLVGTFGGFIILISLFFIGLLLLFNAPLSHILGIPILFKKKQDSDEQSFVEDEEDHSSENELVDGSVQEVFEPINDNSLQEDKSEVVLPDPVAVLPVRIDDEGFISSHIPKVKFDAEKIKLPLDLLDKAKEKPTGADIINGKRRIQKTFETFGINVEMGETQVGPTITQYTFKPAPGVRLAKITALQDNLSLALAAHPLRLEAPIPGQSLVGLEVPNKQVATVTIRELLESPDFVKRAGSLMVTLGKDVSGKPWIVDISGMPHLLVAGATGSGKSVCLNTLIVSLLYQNTPEILRFIMVDPKRVELPVYNGIPHLLTPVITDVKKTVNALKWAIGEMDRRYELLAAEGKRNIKGYNENREEVMPYIVIVIDELADLMVMASADIEGSIIRLTQMARAVGIHLIVATQRPSVDVITGLIKANIPARIAFSVASLVDSRTILDSQGAEKLIGRGDMLFLTADLGKPRRIQGAYISDEEIKRIVRYLKDALELPVTYNSEIVEKGNCVSVSDDNLSGSDGGDSLFEDARVVVIKSGKASASLLQRRLRVGYSRAARLIDLLEEAGVVGPAQGAKPREILVTEEVDNNIIDKNQ